VRRGEVYDAVLDPIQGSEQAGIRPVAIVSRDAINSAMSIVVAVPLTTYRSRRQIHPSRVLVRAPEGGLRTDSVALCEQVQVLSKRRFRRQRGSLSAGVLAEIDRALLITLDLPGQH
jgi:mRNA interferase MazF